MPPRPSAGLLVHRASGRGVEVLLVHPGGPYWARRDMGAWTIPKGVIEPGEAPLAAARREFTEETGATMEGTFVPLRPVTMRSGKVVHAWAVSGDLDTSAISSLTVAIEWPPRSGRRQEFPEVDRADWFTVEEARRRILPAQAPLIDDLLRLLAEPHGEPMPMRRTTSSSARRCGSRVLRSRSIVCAADRERSPRTPDVLTQDRYRGALLGLACGDALGTTLEFRRPGTFEPIADMCGGGPFDLAPGQWTDDTSMALCLAESLLHSRGFDPADQMQRYLRWYDDGHHSSTGVCFDIGSTVRAALESFRATGNPWSGSTAPRTAGNGSIMRLAPEPLYFAADPAQAIRRSAESSQATHGAVEAVGACRYLAALILGALAGRSRAELLQPRFAPVAGAWDAEPLAPAIATVADGSFLRREPPHVRGTGYVVESLEAALWAFARSDSFEHGALLAVNLGDDADTTGAVYGQIAGAYYGAAAIPARWLERLTARDLIERLADGLLTRTAP